MSFPVDLAATLTGATVGQLNYWRRTGVLDAEASEGRDVLYSFRDLAALRTVVWLRQTTSLQRVRRAFESMARYDLTEHPSQYKLIVTGQSIAVERGEEIIDLVAHPGQEVIADLADVFEAFVTPKGRQVPNFLRPRPSLEVRQTRLGGWPTVAGTRVGYDVVAALAADGSVPLEQVSYYFPDVSADAARDALSFADQVADQRRAAA